MGVAQTGLLDFAGLADNYKLKIHSQEDGHHMKAVAGSIEVFLGVLFAVCLAWTQAAGSWLHR